MALWPGEPAGAGAEFKSGLLDAFVCSAPCAGSSGRPSWARTPSAIPFCLLRASLSLKRQFASHVYSSCDLLDGSCLLSSAENSRNMRIVDRWAGEDHGRGLVQGG